MLNKTVSISLSITADNHKTTYLTNINDTSSSNSFIYKFWCNEFIELEIIYDDVVLIFNHPPPPPPSTIDGLYSCVTVVRSWEFRHSLLDMDPSLVRM